MTDAAKTTTFDFTGKSVFVTGASRGLGAAIARGFASGGADLVVVGFREREEDAASVVAEIEQAGGTAMAVAIDVAQQESVDAAFAQLRDEDVSIDILVNNAAIVRDAWFAMTDEADWLDVIDVNLSGTFRCCRAVVRPMMARRAGVIVNIGSVAGLHASPGQTSYSAAKGGIVSMTRTMAAELAPKGIRVNSVVPGLLTTGMGSRLDHRVVQERTAAIPLGRLGDADEVVAAVLFVASDQASYLVGQSIVVDGGLSL